MNESILESFAEIVEAQGGRRLDVPDVIMNHRYLVHDQKGTTVAVPGSGCGEPARFALPGAYPKTVAVVCAICDMATFFPKYQP